jgi:hypothetical protein
MMEVGVKFVASTLMDSKSNVRSRVAAEVKQQFNSSSIVEGA